MLIKSRITQQSQADSFINWQYYNQYLLLTILLTFTFWSIKLAISINSVNPLLPAKPDEPKGPIRFDEIDATTVTCSWDPPVRDGGAPISGYMVEQRDAHRPGWVPVCDSVSRPTFKFENLIEGDEYVFRAAAINNYGTGEFLQSEIVTCKSLKSKTSGFF